MYMRARVCACVLEYMCVLWVIVRCALGVRELEQPILL